MKNIWGKAFGPNRIRLIDFILSILDDSKSPKNRAYKRLIEIIEGFEKRIKRKVFIDSFDDELTAEYIDFLRTASKRKKTGAYRQTSLRCIYQRTISVLYKAMRQGHNATIDSLRLKHPTSIASFAVYLTENEVERIAALDLPRSQASIRDLFIIGCCTALRFSDVIHLTRENFADDIINVLTKKTKAKVSIPIHRLVRRMIARDPEFRFLGYTCSNNYFNSTLKIICKKAGICQHIFVEEVEGGQIVRRTCEKWELVSSHTARRTAATNMYLNGIEPYRIMMVTGHKTETSFLGYLRITAIENAKFLQDNPFFTGKPIDERGEMTRLPQNTISIQQCA